MLRFHFVSAHFGGKAPWKNFVESDKYQVTNRLYDDTNTPSRHLALHPRLKAKIPKMLEWRCIEADWYVWLDSSIRLKSNDICELIVESAGDNPLCLFKHSYASNIRDEARRVRENLDRNISYIQERYSGEPILEQIVEYYADESFVDDKLFGMTMFAYRKEASQLMTNWFEHNVVWTIQDQLSFPYVLSKSGLGYGEFNFNITDQNEYFSWDWRGRERSLEGRSFL